jgi:hypothetical protein
MQKTHTSFQIFLILSLSSFEKILFTGSVNKGDTISKLIFIGLYCTNHHYTSFNISIRINFTLGFDFQLFKTKLIAQ